MLEEIAKVVGGYVRSSGEKKEEVLWVVNNKDHVAEVIKIYEEYPPLTTKKYCDLQFMKDCMGNGRTVEWYMSNRAKKHEGQVELIKARNEKFEVPAYFDK
jgi:hypothetical protein